MIVKLRRSHTHTKCVKTLKWWTTLFPPSFFSLFFLSLLTILHVAKSYRRRLDSVIFSPLVLGAEITVFLCAVPSLFSFRSAWQFHLHRPRIFSGVLISPRDFLSFPFLSVRSRLFFVCSCFGREPPFWSRLFRAIRWVGCVANFMSGHITTPFLFLSRLGAIHTFIKANHVADDRLHREFPSYKYL